MLTLLPGPGTHVPSGSQSEPPMTEAQSEGVQSLLAAHDPDALTQEAARSIVSGISELGIRSGRGLSAVLSEAGFNARDLAKTAGIKRPAAPPEPKQQDIHDQPAVKMLREVVSSLQGLEPEDFREQLNARLEAAGISPDGPIVDYRA